MDSIIPEFEKYVKPFLKKCDLTFFLLDKALSELRPKSLNKAPLKTTDCQYATNMRFSIEDFRKNIPLVL